MSLFGRAVRSWRASPGTFAAAVVTLGVAVGANSAVFSIADALLLRKLPVPDPDRLYLVSAGDSGYWPHTVWEDLRRRRLFERACAWTFARFEAGPPGRPELVDGAWVSGGFFDTLGIGVTLGRALAEADDRRGGGPDGPVAVISHDLWQRQFGGAPDVVGRTLSIERRPFTIVGVTARGFHGPEVGLRFDVLVPFGSEPVVHGRASMLDGLGLWVRILTRLAPGEAVEEVARELRRAQPAIREATRPDFTQGRDRDAWLAEPMTLSAAASGPSPLRARYGGRLAALVALSLLVLAVACVNVANLLLARSAARRRELAIRAALGASRLRLAADLACEALLLAAAGTTLGVLLGHAASRALVEQFSTHAFTAALHLPLDLRVLALASAVGTLTALAFGTAAAARASRGDATEWLRTSGTGADAGGGRLGQALVTAQVALSLTLLVAAGLLIRTFDALSSLRLGFDAGPVTVVSVDARRVPDGGGEGAALWGRAVEAAATAPGVVSAAASAAVPLGGMAWIATIDEADAPGLPEAERTVARNVVTPGWFATLGTRVLAGREFSGADAPGSVPVAIVNQAFARRFLRDGPPIGRVVRQAFPAARSFEVVGVVDDAVYRALREPAPATIYTPVAQEPPADLPRSFSVVARGASRPPAWFRRALSAAVADVDGELVLRTQGLAEQVGATFRQERIVALLAGAFGAMSVLLVSVGLHGVVGHWVVRRRPEIGVRLAVGATPAAVRRLVLWRAARAVGGGLAAGAVLSWWAARFIEGLLFRLPARDPVAFGAAAVLLAVVGFAAAWLPASRAAATDPVVVLRQS